MRSATKPESTKTKLVAATGVLTSWTHVVDTRFGSHNACYVNLHPAPHLSASSSSSASYGIQSWARLRHDRQQRLQQIQQPLHVVKGVVDVLGYRLVFVEVAVEGIGHLVPTVDVTVPGFRP